MSRQTVIAFLVAGTLGALVWALSPTLTGHTEPWDADGPYYVSALAVAGAAAGAGFPKPLWAHYLGAFAGQVAYELCFLELGALFALGVLFLLGYSVVFLVAAAMAAYVRRRWTGRRHAHGR